MTVVLFVLSLVLIINADSGESSSTNSQRQYGDYGQYGINTPSVKTQDTNGKQYSVIVDHNTPYQNSESYSKNIGNGHNSQNKVVNSDGKEDQHHVLHAKAYDGRSQSKTVPNHDYKPDDCDDGISIATKPDGSRVYDIGNGGSNENVLVIGQRVYTNKELRTKTTDHKSTNYASPDKTNGNGDVGTTRTQTQNSNRHHNVVISDNSAYPNSNGYSINIGNGNHRRNNVIISQGTGGETEVHAQTFNGYPQGSQASNDGVSISTGPGGMKTLNYGNGNENVDVIAQKEHTNNKHRIQTETKDFARENNRNIYDKYGKNPFISTQNKNGIQHSVIVDDNIGNPNTIIYSINIGNADNGQNIISEGNRHVTHTQTFDGNSQSETISNDDNKPEDCDDGISITTKLDGSRDYDIGKSGSNKNVLVIGKKVYTNNEPRTGTTGEDTNYARQDKRNGNDEDRTTTTKPIQINPTYPNSNGYSINFGNGNHRRNNVVISEGTGGETEIHAQTYNGYPQESQGKTSNNDYIPKNSDGFSTGPGGTRVLNIGNGANNENVVVIGQMGTNTDPKIDLRRNFDNTHPNGNDKNINMLVGKGKDNQNLVYSDA